ncbi:MAG: hypothetical protein SFX73_33155 [Kofleriaceae bacterium]|nr:hypothetical protein [Kofleriaceae bacterium]
MPSMLSGASTLPLVHVDTHSEELKDDDGFIGDRANRRAFNTILQDWRDRVRAIVEDDPLSEREGALSKKRLDRVHAKGDALAAGLMHTAIEEFSGELADITCASCSRRDGETRSTSWSVEG